MPLSHAPSRSCLSVSILPPRVCILLWLLSVCPFRFEAPGVLLKLTPHSLRNHSHFKTSILACIQMFSRSPAHIHGRYWKIPAEDLTSAAVPHFKPLGVPALCCLSHNITACAAHATVHTSWMACPCLPETKQGCRIACMFRWVCILFTFPLLRRHDQDR